jgi:O-antigen/teichoic acid export membrane protein
MGLNSSINRYIPVYLVRNDDEGIRSVISTSFFFLLALAIVLVLASLIIYYNIGSWFAIEDELVCSAGMLVLAVGFCGALAMPLQLSTAVLSGLQRYDIVNSIVLVFLLLRTVLLIILLRLGFGLVTMGLIFGISEIAMRVLQISFAKILLPQFSISLQSFDFKLLREMLAYGINTFLYAMGAIIIYKAADIVIGIFLGTAEVSQFAIATAGVLLLSQFLQAFSRAVKPAVSDLDARDEQLRIREIAFLTQKYCLLLIIPAGCFLVLMGREFLWVWVGEKFQDPAVIENMAIILAILTIGHCLRLAQHSNFIVLVGRGEHKVFGVLTGLMALLCVCASVISVKVYHLGLLGIAWSNFVPMVLISGIALPLYFNWKMHIAIRQSIRRVWGPALLGSLPSVVMISLWKYLSAPTCWFNIATVILSAALVTALCGWFFSFSELERKRFLKILLPARLRNPR